MKKVLYISNVEVPYRTVFFNQLSKCCDLDVLYEREQSKNGNEIWSKSETNNFKTEYLKGKNIGNEFSIDFNIFKYILNKKYDVIIFGCFNSFIQIFAMTVLKILKINYYLNLDGEYFLDGKSIKAKIKRVLIRGAQGYFVAGNAPSERLKKYIDKKRIYTYLFSSLTKDELIINEKSINKNINNSVLVVGQYQDYKGLDVALEVAKLDSTIQYIFIGAGKNSNALKNKVKELELNNVVVIPFLQKRELFKEYQKCKLLLLPSKKECWGLVINEAASFGCPIISTRTSGAGEEFLKDQYDCYLAEPNNPKDILNKIKKLYSDINIDSYKKFLINKSTDYTIENNVASYLRGIDH